MGHYQRKVIYIKLINCFLFVAILLLPFNVYSIMKPPNTAQTEAIFQECYDDIQTVVDLMISLEYETIIIDSDERTGLVNTDGYHFESVELALDTKTEESVSRLLSGEYDRIVKSENTIEITQWHWFNDIECGVAYAINGHELPEIEYVTELIPMEEDGWYYYVSDFNQWRLENK